MNDDELLRQITVAEPCSADWSALHGDDRARFCTLCNKRVYNLESMSTDEAACLIRARNGSLCVRMQAREAPGANSPPRGRLASLCQFHIRFIMAAVAGVGAFLGITRTWWRSEEPSAPQRARSGTVVGEIACPPALLPPAVSSPIPESGIEPNRAPSATDDGQEHGAR